MKKKPVFIIPGFRQKPRNKAYKTIARMLKREGYTPIPVNVPWGKHSLQTNTELFIKEYKKIRTKKKYILGFSFGALIAFLASTQVDVSGLILCSLSPYFREDAPKRYRDFAQLECTKLARQIKAKQIMMLYGTREDRKLKRRVNEAFDDIVKRDKQLLPIRKVEHNIGDRRYLQTIHHAALQLN